MKIAECWQQYWERTKVVTDQSRKLGLVVGAACWFFKTPEGSFPPYILRALVSLVAFFFLDLLQFFVAAALLRWWTRREETTLWKTKGTVEGDVEKPWWLDKPPFVFFVVKIFAFLVSFAFLSAEFIKRL